MPHTRLKRFLFENGVRQTVLAEKTGNTPAYICGLALGRFAPSIDKASEIVLALRGITGKQVTVDDFWGPGDNHLTVTSNHAGAK